MNNRSSRGDEAVQINWHQLDLSQTLERLHVEPLEGLSQAEVQLRQSQYGSNELIESNVKSSWRMVWEQLTASTILILLAAAAISLLLQDYKDAAAILAIVLLTTLIGFNQEYRTSKAIAALKKLTIPVVKVRREAQYQEIPAHGLVPGDMVLLETGNLVPADCRLIESVNLRVQESALTGEAAPVEKDAAFVATNLSSGNSNGVALADRCNMVYMGTIVLYGRGQAIVTEIGMQTELGKIADLVQAVEQEPTPLQQRLDQLGQKLVLAVLALTTIIFAFGLLRHEPVQLMFLTAVSIAVGVVPEGLPAIVTIALAIGAQRMLKQQALIRRLPAVETLGSVTVICSDKTGTLTENQMMVATLATAEQIVSQPADFADLSVALRLLLMASTLCNNAIIQANPTTTAQLLGDPTEVALVAAGIKAGFQKSELEQLLPRVAEIPFEADRKRMTTIHHWDSQDGPSEGSLLVLRSLMPADANPASTPSQSDSPVSYIAFTKGAFVNLLEVSQFVWVEDHIEPLDAWRDRIVALNQQLAHQGMRVLAVAYQGLTQLPSGLHPDTVEQNLILIGLVGMSDPARPEAKQAIQTCEAAGIRPVMITGDQPLVAQYIAQELGIATNHTCLTGSELTHLSPEQLADQAESVSVYARVSPEQKLKIVQALQDCNHIVAMTGDGVNDAPALRKADIGVAMGITGTDVAKESADMVLLDDNFTTIIAAVKEGRVIYDNIRRCIKYLLGGNSGEIWVMLLAPLVGMPLPLLPIQILWINLMSDGFPALALSIEPAEADTMNRPPYPPDESIFARRLGWDIFWMGLTIGVVCLVIGYWYWHVDPQTNWQTLVFTTMTFSETIIALALRSDRRSVFQMNPFSNLPLLGAVGLTLGLQLAIIYLPALQGLFQTASLSLAELGISLAASTIVFWMLEGQKWFIRSTSKKVFD